MRACTSAGAAQTFHAALRARRKIYKVYDSGARAGAAGSRAHDAHYKLRQIIEVNARKYKQQKIFESVRMEGSTIAM